MKSLLVFQNLIALLFPIESFKSWCLLQTDWAERQFLHLITPMQIDLRVCSGYKQLDSLKLFMT